MNKKQKMKIEGKYRDVVMKNGKVIKDFGWKSNTIAADYGDFLAALMKKEFPEPMGIEYIALGNSGEDHNFDAFRTLVDTHFNDNPPLQPGQPWAWAKQVFPDNITFLDVNDNETGEISNKLKIELTIEEDEPSEETLDFREFALLGIEKKPDNSFNTEKMFLINYVHHGPITKDENMKLTRTIKLTFPINDE